MSCSICKKSFKNLELHHTKSHAVFKFNNETLYKDGKEFAKFYDAGWGDKGSYWETKGYRLYQSDDKQYTLYSTKNSKTFMGGEDGQIITRNIIDTNSIVLINR